MSIRIGTAVAATLGLVACTSSTTSEIQVKNTDAASLKASPAGVATTVFTDLESIRPDNLATGTSSSGCVTVSPLSPTSFRYTFNGCQSANGGTMTGTVTVTTSGTGTVVNNALFDVVVTDATSSWHYAGTKVITLNASARTASLTVPDGQPFTVSHQVTADASKNKAWTYTTSLQADWSNASAVRFWGEYAFHQAQPVGDTMTVTIPQVMPLTWSPGCAYPSAGVLNLSLPPASAEVRFNTSITDATVQQGCGVITINGYRLALGQ
ncbi:hypothetical protein [Geothrix sp. PMB-07]|uniref:hypothetical protein n=1 Tax=Geothrix sp. PMB-07 TaxID=3068640 RepID=UPI0027425EFE|nr:hypothetical protein [Geothrix sp. PMB-07]WLT33105.1 hypothetical protein Q9293_07190 [Geothrix sp. PMB-07]